MLSKMQSCIMVPPMAQPLVTIKTRPSMYSPGVQSAKRNLFGSCQSGDIDDMLAEEKKRTSNYLLQRYSLQLDQLEENCNKQISAEARVTGIKRTFRVRKSCNGDSKVPKRKIHQISSGSGSSDVSSNNNNCSSSSNNNNEKKAKKNDAEADSHINSELGGNGAKRMCNKNELQKQ